MEKMTAEGRLEQAAECLASGQSVKQWASEHGVSAQTMYVWTRRLRELEAHAAEPAFVEVTDTSDSHRAPGMRPDAPGIICRVGSVQAMISPGTSEYDILAFLEAATSL